MLRGTVPYLQMVWYIPGCIEKLALLLFGRCLVPQILFQRQFLIQDGIEILKIVNGNITNLFVGWCQNMERDGTCHGCWI